YHTGEAARRGDAFRRSATEVTPILAEGKLVFCTPFDRVIALDPATGRELWVFDPGFPVGFKPGNGFICRGVSVWHDAAAAAGAACATRVFLGTNDARLIALDLATGKRCSGFGEDGEVSLLPDIPPLYPGERQIDSAPALVNGIVVVGSAVDDMTRARAPSGTVRAFDARTGAPRWSFDPVPRRADDPAAASWSDESYRRDAGGGAWAPIAVDPARDLVFLPTAGPTASFYGAERPGNNLYTSSVVALRGATGAVVWSFQTTHHDLWDDDVAAQPSLVTLHRGGKDVAALVVAAKTGFVFVLDRDTGKPLFPIEERPFPASDVPGEKTSPTQPVPLAPPPLVPQRLTPDDAWGLLYFDKLICRRKLEALDTRGLYTPPGLKGTVIFPFTGGGGNWGGGAVDPARQLFIVNTMRLAHMVRLIPRAEVAAARQAAPGVEIGAALGTPYGAERDLLTSPLGLPCNAPPWGVLSAVDLDAGTIKWQVPLGEKAFGLIRGLPGVGGPIVTAGGLVFIGASVDQRLRAFDVETGKELWQASLPAGAEATPMTYVVDGRQFVVIAAGGHWRMPTPLGDAILAFALPP
ncbi:MAG TPA: pyrroloquinoline quinone-dependent dehydrogenase, partial [Stellaceae bacterium]|nr:pyrroloquinoline quinone-dependent dehydrogenase [Stellaceae bacterium]